MNLLCNENERLLAVWSFKIGCSSMR